MAVFEPTGADLSQSAGNQYSSRPLVNLPPNSAHGIKVPRDVYHIASAQPNTMTLNDTMISPEVGIPQVHLPPDGQMHTRHLSDTHQLNYNLESQLRDMIIHNGVPEGIRPHQTMSHHCQSPEQQTAKKPNQGRRRQQAGQMNVALPHDSSVNRQDLRPAPRTQKFDRQYSYKQCSAPHFQLPHLRGFPQQQKFMPPAQQQYPALHGVSNPQYHTATGPSHSSSRPVVNSRQLYNPNSHWTQSLQQRRSRDQTQIVSVDAQVGFLNALASVEIPKAEISNEEFDEKQRLRLTLENVCRNAVSKYEIEKDPAFLAEKVELKCFGSLSTTFATKSSDMDLVLVSPMSKPETSSPESELPRLIEKALLDLGYGVRLLTRTRVPIIRFCEKPTPELAGLLVAERAKWENERHTPSESKSKAQNKPEGTKEDGPNDLEIVDNITLDAATVPMAPLSGPLVNRRDIEGPSKPLPYAVGKSVTAERVAYGEDKSSSLPGDWKQPKNVTDTSEGKTVARLDVEGNDASLSDKPDGERVHLYKLAMKDGWYEPTERKVITAFIQAYQKRNSFEFTQGQLDQARISLRNLPNVLGRFRPPPAPPPLDFPKDGVGIQCDINFSNHLALHNSHLLKCYASCDPRVRQMVLFVKAWSKRRKINTPYHGTLSSYGYVLMVLHYLINIAQPFVLPNLQHPINGWEDTTSGGKVFLDGHNIQYFRNESMIQEYARRGFITRNQESLGSLLRGFFHYYAHQGYASPAGGFGWTQDALSLRTLGGTLPKEAKGWTEAKTETVVLAGPGPQTKEIRQRYLFAIEDPFEIDHNIARTVVHNGIVSIRDEFRRAHRLIENVGTNRGKAEDLFAEAEEKENLQYRPFGPRPRKDYRPVQNMEKGSGPAPGQKNRASVEPIVSSVKDVTVGKVNGGGVAVPTVIQ